MFNWNQIYGGFSYCSLVRWFDFDIKIKIMCNNSKKKTDADKIGDEENKIHQANDPIYK